MATSLPKFFTLHARLTRDCNAHCTYCSSAGVSAGHMSRGDFERSIDFIVDEVFPRLGVGADHFVTTEYLGGEILLLPQADFEACVAYARSRIGAAVRGYRDTAQSNLIGSPRRVRDLHDLFDGRMSTSWDPYTGKRHIHGSAQLYNGILNRSLRTLDAERGKVPGRIMVVDRHTAPHAAGEVRRAIAEGYGLRLKPAFVGGSADVDMLAPEEMRCVMRDAYLAWRTKLSHPVEPFITLFERRERRGTFDAAGADRAAKIAGCPFQSDCAFKSLDLDPDGRLYVCQEMADAGQYPLGNAITGTFDDTTWRLLARRTAFLSSDCSGCQWNAECGGGCMSEAIQAHGDPFAKTELCATWKTLFALIEEDIARGASPSA